MKLENVKHWIIIFSRVCSESCFVIHWKTWNFNHLEFAEFSFWTFIAFPIFSFYKFSCYFSACSVTYNVVRVWILNHPKTENRERKKFLYTKSIKLIPWFRDLRYQVCSLDTTILVGRLWFSEKFIFRKKK